METNLSNQQKGQPNLSTLSEELVKQYGLYEDIETMYQKGEKGLLSNEGIINFSAQDLADGKITEKEMSDSFQKNFALPKTTIQKIIADVKKDIIPCLKRIREESLKTDVATEKNKNGEREQEQDRNKIGDKELKEKTHTQEVIIEKNKVPIKTIQPAEQKPKGQDTYREPIG